jgi:hypothetical protein
MRKAGMHLLPTAASTSASTGPTIPTVPLVPTAEMRTPAASAEMGLMGRGPAEAGDDPCVVITPFNHLRVEELLRKYDIFNDWCHIVDGLRNGFNVGIQFPPSSTHTF